MINSEEEHDRKLFLIHNLNPSDNIAVSSNQLLLVGEDRAPALYTWINGVPSC